MSFLDLSFWSIIPPLLAIFLVLKTRKVLLSLAIGIAFGCFLIAKFNPIEALNTFVDIFFGTNTDEGTLVVGSITTPDNLMVLFSMIMIGALVGLLVKSGGSHAFAEYMSQKVNNKERSGIMACLICTALMLDDYFDNLTAGAAMRPIADKNKVSREKLAYYIDTTVCGINSVSPISSWAAFLTGLVAMGMATAGIEGNSYLVLLKSIPYNFFIFASLIMVYCAAAFNINVGSMAEAERQVAANKERAESVYDEVEIAKGRPMDLIFPIVFLICSVIFFMFYTGGFFKSFNIVETISNMDGIRALMYGLMFSLIVIFVYFYFRKTSPLKELTSAALIGIKSIVYADVVLILGWTLGGVTDALNISGFLVSVFQGNIPAVVIPVILFLLCAATAFAIGGGWVTFAIMIPAVIPFVAVTGADMTPCISAIIGGAGLGATCSPLADTSIVSSMSAETTIVDHIRTQIPYSLTCGIVAIAGYLALGITGNLIVSYAITGILLAVSMIAMKRISVRKSLPAEAKKKIKTEERIREKEDTSSKHYRSSNAVMAECRVKSFDGAED